MAKKKGQMSKRAAIKLMTNSTLRRESAAPRPDLDRRAKRADVNNWPKWYLYRKAYADLYRARANGEINF